MSEQDASVRRWSRRSALALGVGALGLLSVPGSARAATTNVGDLLFDVPTNVSASSTSRILGQSWEWTGRSAGGIGLLADLSLLVRADLPSTDATEVLGLLLAGSATGQLPGLVLNVLRPRAMPGGGDQVRVDLAYAADEAVPYHGTLLIATRPEPPAAVVAVLGTNSLTAGTIAAILDGVRWR